jgi:hypothetical protein
MGRLFAVWSVVAATALGVAGTAAAQSGRPSAVIAVHMPTTDLQVVDMKYRVFFNKRENKSIPVTDFDFAANLQDELGSVLEDDGRVRWRTATAAEAESLKDAFGPTSWKAKTAATPGIEADRVLLVGTAYGAFIHAMRKFIEVSVAMRFVDRQSGKVLWKKSITERTKLPDTLEDMQADNQKVLKETLIKAADDLTPKIKAHLRGAKL